MFTPSMHIYRVDPAGYGCQEVRLATQDGTVLHIDTFRVKTERGRTRFLRSVRAKRGDDGADAVATELLAISANLESILPETNQVYGIEDMQPYFQDERGIFYDRPRNDSPVPSRDRLSNFGAHILVDTTVDDGSETWREYTLECWSGERRQQKTIRAELFESLGWRVDMIGSAAVVFPGSKHEQHIVAAIQLTSTPDLRSVYGHTGWRQLDDGQMGYLTASGAITTDGLRSDVAVKLDEFDRYCLPEPPAGDDERSVWRQTMELLDIGKRPATIPIMGAMIRSLFGPSDFALYLMGSTGSGKTTIAGLYLGMLGSGLDAEHLPANYTGTGNSLEAIAHLLKDAPLVIDDFQRNRAANVDATAERIGRALGNQSGRTRLTREAKLQKTKVPRGTVIMTGEDIPRGESLRSRMTIVEIAPGDVRLDDAMTEAQALSKQGVYAQAMASFVRWIAIDHDTHMATFRQRFEETRALLRDEHAAHPRSVATAAHLLSAYMMLGDYLESIGWSADEASALVESAEDVLRSLIDAQAAHLKSANPIDQFLDALDSVLFSGEGYVSDSDGNAPRNPSAWGWQEQKSSSGYESELNWRTRAGARRIGFVKSGEPGVFLVWDEAFTVIQRRAVGIGNELPLNRDTLLKRLGERGMLLSRDDARQTFKIRRRLSGKQVNVAHLNYPQDGGES